MEKNKNRSDRQLTYCNVKLSSAAIKLLHKTKGALPTTYMHALSDIKRLTNENEKIKKFRDETVEQYTKLVLGMSDQINKIA